MSLDNKLDHKLKVKAEDPIWQLHAHDIDLQSNHIYLFGAEVYAAGADIDIGEPGVEYVMTNRFIRNLNLCMRVNPDKPIVVHMKTCGGDWSEGMAIYDAIKTCPSPVIILNYTHARSMSSLIFQASKKRVMMPNSYFMFHRGTLSADGTVLGIESYVAQNKLSEEVMLGIYIKSMKVKGKFKSRSKKFIRSWLADQMNRKEDVYMTAQQAIDYGLADEIFDGNWANLTNLPNNEQGE